VLLLSVHALRVSFEYFKAISGYSECAVTRNDSPLPLPAEPPADDHAEYIWRMVGCDPDNPSLISAYILSLWMVLSNVVEYKD
jgi:hypothetical protein